MKELKTIGIAGAGIMGQGIAAVAARSGFTVCLYDSNKNALEAGIKKIKNHFRQLVDKGKMDQTSADDFFSLISSASELKDIARRDLIIEAISENFDGKIKLFEELDSISPDNVIFASNTSTIPISALAKATKRPDRFIGMHFMNPVFLIPLVEIIAGKETSGETVAQIKEMAKIMGKTPVVARDSPGFVMNRLLIPMINEAAFCLREGIASKEDIDKIMKIGANFPMGPFELADLIGIDTCLSIMEELQNNFGDTKYAACPLLKKMVESGSLGRKSGQGFYNYK